MNRLRQRNLSVEISRTARPNLDRSNPSNDPYKALVARLNAEKRMREFEKQERNNQVLRKLEMQTAEQKQKFQETKERIEHDKLRKIFEKKHKKDMMREERARKVQEENKTVKQLLRKQPLYKLIEHGFEAEQELEKLEKLAAAQARRHRINFSEIDQHDLNYSEAKQ